MALEEHGSTDDTPGNVAGKSYGNRNNRFYPVGVC